jgi:hypothetical protein
MLFSSREKAEEFVRWSWVRCNAQLIKCALGTIRPLEENEIPRGAWVCSDFTPPASEKDSPLYRLGRWAEISNREL